MKSIKIIGRHRMWAWFILLTILICFLVALLSGSLQIKRNIRTNAPLDEFKAYMDERITALMKQYGIPGCNIALVRDKEVVWTKGYGYADVASGRALAVDTPMSVQSITKSVTAWGVMRLVEKGLIDLDTPVSEYLKSWQFPLTNYPTEKITVRQLLEHTAGLPLGDFTNIYSPGQAMPSNRDVMTREAVPVYLYPSKASGGLFATAHEIARFAAAGMQVNPVLSGDSIKLMYSPRCRKIGIYGLIFDAYGFGHYIEKLPNGMLSVSHGGQGNGIMTHWQAVPETGDAIVLLTNSQRSWPFIAYVLSDWAQWRGFPSVGMGRIIWGNYILCLVIGMLVAASLLVILRLVSAFCQQNPMSFRLLRISAASILLGTLFWCACQQYLFITSVFPILSVWLAGAAFAFSIVLLLSVVIPEWTGKKFKL